MFSGGYRLDVYRNVMLLVLNLPLVGSGTDAADPLRDPCTDHRLLRR